MLLLHRESTDPVYGLAHGRFEDKGDLLEDMWILPEESIPEEKVEELMGEGKKINVARALASAGLEGLSKFHELERQRKLREQHGKGIAATAAGIIQAAKKLGDVAVGAPGAALSNTLHRVFNKNPHWRPTAAGEAHMVLPTKYGLTRANYAGPGTHLRDRLARGDIGVDGPRGIDAAARLHDIDYANAQTPKDVRKADNVFIDRVRNSTQGPKTKKFVETAMRAKKLGEDVGILHPMGLAKGKNLFTGNGKKSKSKKPGKALRAKMKRKGYKF